MQYLVNLWIYGKLTGPSRARVSWTIGKTYLITQRVEWQLNILLLQQCLCFKTWHLFICLYLWFLFRQCSWYCEWCEMSERKRLLHSIIHHNTCKSLSLASSVQNYTYYIYCSTQATCKSKFRKSLDKVFTIKYSNIKGKRRKMSQIPIYLTLRTNNAKLSSYQTF